MGHDKCNQHRCVHMVFDGKRYGASPYCALAKKELDEIGFSTSHPHCVDPEKCKKRVSKLESWMVWETMFPIRNDIA